VTAKMAAATKFGDLSERACMAEFSVQSSRGGQVWLRPCLNRQKVLDMVGSCLSITYLRQTCVGLSVSPGRWCASANRDDFSSGKWMD
jgi:hypothetical protein